LRHQEGVFFGLTVEGIEQPALAIVVKAGGRFALERIARLPEPGQLESWLKPWLKHDIPMAFCTDAALTHDFAGPRGERRIDRLYRRLAPGEFDGFQRVSKLQALKNSGVRALHAASIAHGLGIPIAETHPRAALSRLGARDAHWLRAVNEYSGGKCMPDGAGALPDGIVKQRCMDLWNGILEKLGVEDDRADRETPTSVEIDALVCALAARALVLDRRRFAIFPWSAADCLIGAQGSYVLLGRVSAWPCVSRAHIKFSRSAAEKSRMSDSGKGLTPPAGPPNGAGTNSAKQKVAEHRYTKTVRSWLSEGGVDLKAVETVRDNGIVWKLTGGEGLSLFLAVYVPDSGGVPFYHLEAAISALKPESENEALKWLLITHNKFPSPFRLALEPEGYIVLQSRAPCDEVSTDYFLWMLNSLIPIADDLLKELSTRFKLRPFAEILKGQQTQKKTG
jgi:hypothetical protein